MKRTITHYGEGGYDPAKPNGNVVATEEIELPFEEANAATIRDKIDQAITVLEAADANWDTLTVAQRLAAQRLAIRIVAKLARHVLGRLESA
jgi:hypothetical protein